MERLLDVLVWYVICGFGVPLIASKLGFEINLRLFILVNVVFLMGMLTHIFRVFS